MFPQPTNPESGSHPAMNSTRPKGSVASGIIYHSMAAFMNGSCPESSGKGETGSNVAEQNRVAAFQRIYANRCRLGVINS